MSQTTRGLLAALIYIAITMPAFAQEETVVVRKVTTPPPKFVNCTIVPAHWEDNVWVADQNVCTYEGRTEGAEWVQDYWACTVSTPDGDCTTWEYRPGHWKTTSATTSTTTTTTTTK